MKINNNSTTANIMWWYIQKVANCVLSFVHPPKFTTTTKMSARPQTCWGTVCRCFWAQRWCTTHPRTTILLGTTTPQVQFSLVWTTSLKHDITQSNLIQPLSRPSRLVCKLIKQQQKWSRAGRSEGKHRPLHGNSGCNLRFIFNHLSTNVFENKKISLSTLHWFFNFKFCSLAKKLTMKILCAMILHHIVTA